MTKVHASNIVKAARQYGLQAKGFSKSIEAAKELACPLYLTPGTERWVQFVPFTAREFEWRLVWGKGDQARGSTSMT